MPRTWSVITASIALALATGMGPAVAHAAETPSVGVIVSFENTRTAPAAAKLISAVDGTSARPLVPEHGVYVFSSPYYQSDSEYAIELMVQSPSVKIAEPNYITHSMTYSAPSDPGYADTTAYATYYSKAWALRSINADKAWQLGQGDVHPARGSVTDVKIGDIDTGAYLGHPDLSAGNVVAGYDYLDSFSVDSTGNIWPVTDGDVTPVSTTVDPSAAHGSAVAACMGAAVNGVGTVGAAWNPTLYVYKDEGICTSTQYSAYGLVVGKAYILRSQELAAIYGAADDGCKVINISQGGTGFIQQEQDAVNYAWDKGAVIVASAGNSGTSTPYYPASFAGVLSIASLGNSGGTLQRSSFSNYGVNIDLSAPGENVWTVSDPSGWGYWSGTSFSSPLTAGAIAYVWRAMPTLTNSDIVTLFEDTARPVAGQTTWSQFTGFGETDAQAAYNALILPATAITVPALTNLSNVPVSWTGAPSPNATYSVSLDGSQFSTTTATGTVVPCADGTHAVQVVSSAPKRFESTATATFVVDATPPSVDGFSYVGADITWNVSDVHAVTVQAAVDSTASPATVSGYAVNVSAQPDGNHVLYVRAVDAAGNSSGWVSYGFSTGWPDAPVAASSTTTDALSGTASWSSVATATAYEFSSDGGATITTTTSLSAEMPLVEGANQFQVRTVNVHDVRSGWAFGTITNVAVVPETPAPACDATVSANHVVVSWPAAADALRYQYHVDSGADTTTTALSADVTLGAQGNHTIYVRSLNNLRESAWATATVTYGVLPTVLDVPARAWQPHVAFTWLAMPNATAYEYRLNGGSVSSTAETSATISGLSLGANTVDVRVVQGPDTGDWTPASVTYAPPSLGLLANPGTVAYRSPVTLSLSADFASRVATIQFSPDTVTWSDAATASLDASGLASVVSVPSRSGYFRALFGGDDLVPPVTSNIAHADVAPIVGGAKAPSRVTRNRRFTAYGYITPAAARGGKVTIALYRSVRSGGRTTWVRSGTVNCKVTSAGANLKYSASIRLSKRGYWKLTPRYQRTAAFADAAGASRTLRVR